MKRLLVLFIWFPSILVTLLTSLLFYSYYTQTLLFRRKLKQLAKRPKFYQMYISHPKTLGVATTSIKTEDAIPELVHQYLKKYNSPMADTAYEFVRIFRDYNIDPTISLAIAQCESNLGKKTPPDCHNPFGLGIHSRGTLCFNTWEEGYEKMAKTLKEKYIDQGLNTPEDIMKKYCPLSVEKGGSWARCINQFIKEIETLTIRKH